MSVKNQKTQKPISPLDLVTSEIIGPSSSHTAGVMRIGQRIKEKMGKITHVHITLFNSLADTGDAHMTQSALVAGLLGFRDNDARTPFSFQYAEDKGMKIRWAHKRDEHMHPNTVVIEASNEECKKMFKGISIGGGRIKFNELNNHKK